MTSRPAEDAPGIISIYFEPYHNELPVGTLVKLLRHNNRIGRIDAYQELHFETWYYVVTEGEEYPYTATRRVLEVIE